MEDDTPWLTRDEARAWLPLAMALETLPSALNAQLRRDSGLNLFDYTILAGLSEAPGRARSMTEIAALAAGSLSRVTHAVERLEQRGWVTRGPHPSGGAVELTLTDEGFAALAAAAPGHVREVRRLVIDALTPAQLDALADVARRLVEGASPVLGSLLSDRLASGRLARD